jgi:N-acetylneuraminic acid mutarotase
MFHRVAAYNGYMYAIGGTDNLDNVLGSTEFAPINADGTLGTWTVTNAFSPSRRNHTAEVVNAKVYLMGGHDGTTYLNDVMYAAIHADGTIASWTAPDYVFSSRYGNTSVAYNGYLYVLGGYNGTVYYSNIWFAPIHVDGTLGTWTTTTPFPTGRAFHTSAAYNGYLYVLGGNNGGMLNDVQYAPLNADGTVGPWVGTTSFPAPRDWHASAAYKGFLYVIGGYAGSGVVLGDVWVATLNADGTVGTWRAATDLPSVRYAHTAAAYNGFLYVVGGDDLSIPKEEVLYAHIQSDGTLGAWGGTVDLPGQRYGHTSEASNGYLYVVGGDDASGFGYYSDVFFAPLQSNGTVGAWSRTLSFTTARVLHGCAVHNGYLYLTCGLATGGGSFNDVQVATLRGPAERGRYSKLVDLGVNQNMESIVFSESSGDGATNLTYAAAPSAGAVFGARTTILDASPGTLYTAGLGTCARYAWVHFDLDDTRSATVDGDGANGRSDLPDFTVNYSSVPSPAASSNSPICAGETLNLYASTIAGATYTWTGPNGFTSNLQNPSIPGATAAAGGTYSVTAAIGACVSSEGTTLVAIDACPPPMGDGTAGSTAARFTKHGSYPGWIDVAYDASTCSAPKAVILYGSLGSFAGYQGSIQCDAGNAGSAMFNGSAMSNVWFNIIWTTGTLAGHPGYGFASGTQTERTWNAGGFCGLMGDDHTKKTCP